MSTNAAALLSCMPSTKFTCLPNNKRFVLHQLKHQVVVREDVDKQLMKGRISASKESREESRRKEGRPEEGCEESGQEGR